jgi:ATP-binding cassette, subfamily B (MDR/TAP), member 1
LMSRVGGAYRQLIEAQNIGSDDSYEWPVSEKGDLVTEDSPDAETEALPISLSEGEESGKVKAHGTFSILRRCLSLSRPRVFFTLLALLGSLITGGLIIGESIIFGNLVQLINGTVPTGQVDFYCLMFFVVALAALAGYVTSGSCFGIVSEHLILRTRDISLRTILRQDMEWFLQPGRSTSSLTSIISMDASHLSGFSGVIIGTMVSGLVSVVGGAILAHIIAWKIAIVLFATSPMVILAGFFRLRVLAKVEEKNQRAYTEAASLATEACLSIRTIAALGKEAAISKRFRLAVDKNREETFRYTALGNMILAFALSIT